MLGSQLTCCATQLNEKRRGESPWTGPSRCPSVGRRRTDPRVPEATPVYLDDRTVRKEPPPDPGSFTEAEDAS